MHHFFSSLLLFFSLFNSSPKGALAAGQLTDLVQGTATFVDACTGNQTKLTTPNGTILRVEFNNLVSSTDLHLKITYTLAGMEVGSFTNLYIFSSDDFSEPTIYTFNLPKDKRMDAVEAANPGSTIWDVSVEWTQGISSGNSISTILRTTNILSFYRKISDDSCKWETSPTISSQFYSNVDHEIMNIQKDFIYYDENGVLEDGGPNLQQEPDGISLPPAIPLTSFYFKGRSQQSSLNHTVEFSRTWHLTQGQAGIFADRYSFNRIQAEHYEWVQDGGACGEYVKTEEGTLDVGTVSTDFYSIPPSFSGDPEKILDFINRMRPPMNTCTGQSDQTPRPGDISSDSNRDLIYFQKNQSSVNPLTQ